MLLHLEICQQSRPWECGNPEGISKECGKGGKPASWLSMLSILLSFPWPALETRFTKSQSPRRPVLGTGTTCPRCRLYRQVALKWVFPPGRLDPPTGFYGVPTESCRKHLSRELPPVNNQLRAASLRTRRLVPIEPAACCLQPGRCWTFGVVSR
jgi:hypothetical protein